MQHIDGPRDCHTEYSQTQRDKYDITYTRNVKQKWYKWTYLQSRNWVTDVDNKLKVTKGKRGWDKLGNWDEHIYTIVFKTDN